MSEQTQKKSYKDTINKPQTAFPMKANLVQNEPASMKRWQQEGLYAKVREARKGAKPYVFHDGPPYANGSIHLGHLLNKVLKDIVVRSRTMMGFDCPYIPGWDCHGLPIEHKVVAELGEKAREMEPYQVRRKCQAYAEKFVKLQSGQMQRLLTLADYDNPYLTMHPAYEGASLEVFAQLVEKGLVYRALKPVHWSIANQTALADAELEYEDRVDTSVYVLFEVANPEILKAASGLATAKSPLHLMIWTTTPWTLPANLAVAAAARAEYGIYRVKRGNHDALAILATDLAAKVLDMGGITAAEPLATLRGDELTKLRYKHPFIDRTSPVVTAEYVTLEDGTGLVHTAPGHGVEDYQTGLKEYLRFSPDRKQILTGKPSDATVRPDVYCPVKEDGSFDDTAPDWLRAPGVDVWKANDLVVSKLRETGHLFHDLKFTHSYPHDWRSKTPVIFRATEQWFVSVDRPIESAGSIRERAIASCDGITFFPDWGKNRLRGMLESRPDWCISRQRAWGLPIPAFFNGQGETLLTPASVRAVAEIIEKQGSDAWFKLSAAELLASYNPDGDPEAPAWIKSEIRNPHSQIRKGTDIFDVWFDSGTSWAAVIRQRGLGHNTKERPLTDLYLEGSDQHRGWFQASLLPAVATTGRPPYANLLTHGFMVDKDGKKMSKSLGNALEVETLLKDHGADVCRWWVSSINTDNDIKVDPEFFRLAGEEYRKVRNTLRYLLSNLYDFDPKTNKHSFTDADATSPDAWVLGELNKLIAAVKQGYTEFNFRGLHEAVFDFCNETLSAVYLAATKDRMYCDRPDSPRRRRSQTAMWLAADAMIRLVAPILPHTADEAWRSLHGDAASSVQIEMFPDPVVVKTHPFAGRLADELWKFVSGELERVRKEQDLAPLDCGVLIHVPVKIVKDWEWVQDFSSTDIADLFGVSMFDVLSPERSTGLLASIGQFGVPSKWWTENPDKATVEIVHLKNAAERDGDHRFDRCERSWKRDGTVKQRSDGGMLSDRDAGALGIA